MLPGKRMERFLHFPGRGMMACRPRDQELWTGTASWSRVMMRQAWVIDCWFFVCLFVLHWNSTFRSLCYINAMLKDKTQKAFLFTTNSPICFYQRLSGGVLKKEPPKQKPKTYVFGKSLLSTTQWRFLFFRNQCVQTDAGWLRSLGTYFCNWGPWLVSTWEEMTPASHCTFSLEMNKMINYKNTAIQVLSLPWKHSMLTGWPSSPLAPVRHLQDVGVATDDKMISFIIVAALFSPLS